MRLGLSATAASAVLYGAVVLFGAESPSPVALDVGGSPRHPSVVLIAEHTDTVSSPAQKLPQASPGPRRHRLRTRPNPRRPAVGSTTSPVTTTVESPPPPTPPTPQPPPRVPTRAAAEAPAPQAGDRSADPVVRPLLNVVIQTVPVPELPLLPSAPPLAPALTVSLELPG